MKKYLKKICTILMALAMLATVTNTTAFAANVPVSTDKINVTINNVERGAVVTGYKIVKANYGTEGGLTGYEVVEGLKIEDISAPTEAEIAAIVAAINAGKSFDVVHFEEIEATGTYSAEVEAGSYLVLVSDTSFTLYNPMIISADYDEESILRAGIVDADGDFVVGGENYYAKKSEPSISKEIVGGSSGNIKGDDLAIGDKQRFEIFTTIPDYSKAYTHATFEIEDTLSGLSCEDSVIQVTVGGTPAPADQVKVVKESNNKIKIGFASDFILSHGNERVIVTYEATLADNAGINYDANTNKVKLTYTNDPSEVSAADRKTADTEAVTYHYTFGIDANLGGTEEGKNSKTHELIKVNEDGSVSVEKVNDGIDTYTTTGALADAVFTLTSKDGSKKYESTSDNKGFLSFVGLDAGEYVLVETKAPDGYTLDTTEHTVVIQAEYNFDGTLNEYSVKIDDATSSEYSAIYDEGGKIKEIIAEDQTALLKNTRIKALPSTGGMGTYLFTIVGVFVMAAAAFMYAFNRKRTLNQQDK